VQQVAKTAPDMLAVVEDKRMHNATPRINRLPLELLTLIFQLVQTRSNAHIFPPAKLKSDANSWLKILRVCHEWRRVALAVPFLWKNICIPNNVIDHEGLSEWFLHNSGKEVLLSWEIDIEYITLGSLDDPEKRNFSAKFLNTFAANLHRIESLSIQYNFHIHLDPADRRLFELLTGPMPSLRALDMRLPWTSNVTFPALGFTGITHISTYALPLPNINFTQLSHLSLERQAPDQRPSLKLFLDFLKANPSLEMLRINDAGPVLSMADLKDLGYPPGVIELPHLHRIQYQISKTGAMDQSDAFYWLLACLSLPEDVTIHLASPKMSAALRHSKQMYAALTRYFNRISSVKLVKLGPIDVEGLLFHGTCLYVEVPLTTSFFQAKGGPYSKVQTLILGENTDKLSPSKLQFLLKSFSGLQRIEVEWERPSRGDMLRSEHPVIRALSNVNTRSKKKFAAGDLPCGDLQELVLKYTNFPQVCPMDGEPPHEDAKYYRSDRKISRGDGLGLYALKGDSWMGPRPGDGSFAGIGYHKFARALQSGDFRYL
jgi:hypothetical protein